MDKRIVESGNGSRMLAAYDEDKDALTVWEEFDPSYELKLAKILSDEPTCKADGMRRERIIPEHVRRERIIPEHVLSRAFTEGWFHDPLAWKRWANSEEGRVFAIEHNGKVNRL
jgi:hypothetical protein